MNGIDRSIDQSIKQPINEILLSHQPSCLLPYGLAVRIPGFHPGGPGSTPGMGMIVSLLVTGYIF